MYKIDADVAAVQVFTHAAGGIIDVGQCRGITLLNNQVVEKREASTPRFVVAAGARWIKCLRHMEGRCDRLEINRRGEARCVGLVIRNERSGFRLLEFENPVGNFKSQAGPFVLRG